MSNIERISEEPMKDQTEFFRFKGQSITLGLRVFGGKDGDVFLLYTPSLGITAYGDDEEEAKKNMDHQMNLFCDDFFALNSTKKDLALKQLGWQKVKYHNKNYSKSFIDTNGVLQNFDKGTMSVKYMEAQVA